MHVYIRGLSCQRSRVLNVKLCQNSLQQKQGWVDSTNPKLVWRVVQLQHKLIGISTVLVHTDFMTPDCQEWSIHDHFRGNKKKPQFLIVKPKTNPNCSLLAGLVYRSLPRFPFSSYPLHAPCDNKICSKVAQIHWSFLHMEYLGAGTMGSWGCEVFYLTRSSIPMGCHVALYLLIFANKSKTSITQFGNLVTRLGI